MGRPVRVLIPGERALGRIGFRSLLGDSSRYQICGEARDGHAAVAKVKELQPDVVILDLNMPGLNGFNAAREIRRIAPSTKIILFSFHEIPNTAKHAGADALVTKTSTPSELLATIDRLTAPAAAKPWMARLARLRSRVRLAS